MVKLLISTVIVLLAQGLRAEERAPRVFRVSNPTGGISSNTSEPAAAPEKPAAGTKKAAGRRGKIQRVSRIAGGTGGAKSKATKQGSGAEGSEGAVSDGTTEAGDISLNPGAGSESLDGIRQGVKAAAGKANAITTGVGGSSGGGALPATAPPVDLNEDKKKPVPSGSAPVEENNANSAF